MHAYAYMHHVPQRARVCVCMHINISYLRERVCVYIRIDVSYWRERVCVYIYT
jgi:hypothetical protein